MKNKINSKKITVRYVVHLTLFYMYMAGASAFAATFLLEKGFNATQVGGILSISSLMACVFQPLIGDVADRLTNFILPQLIAGLFAGSFVCYTVIMFLKPPLIVFGILYGMGLFLTSLTNSLNSSLCAYYTNQGYSMNYGAGEGAGSLSFSLASLGLGYVMAWFGVDSMIWIVLMLIVMIIIIVLKYPKISLENETRESASKEPYEERVSIFQFFAKYKLFTITMFGIMMEAMCHTMSENYYIEIFKNIGGGSEHVGIALFVACISAVPFFLYFEKLRGKFGIHIFLRTGGIFFMLKMFLLLQATQVWHVYIIQLLQLFTFGFIHQPLYYLARQRVSTSDLVKGQAVAVSLYSLGGSFGSFVGGRIIDLWGIRYMLTFALLIAFVGTVIINMTLGKEKKR